MDFSEYLFRCHMVGKVIDVPKSLTKNQLETLASYQEREGGVGRVLTNKQLVDLTSLKHKRNESKVYKIGDGTKNILSELVFAEKYKRKIDINSDKLSKGIEVEKDSRDILSRVTGLFLTSSTERKSNKWVTGAIDIEPEDVITDIKSAYSWTSFCKILQEKPNEIYLRQGDSYMDLWNKKHFLLCHILTDTPHKIIDGEIRRSDYQNNILDVEGNVREGSIDDVKKVVTNHIFSRKSLEVFCENSPTIHIEWFSDFVEIPENERVHMIPHAYNSDRIEQRNKCIDIARDYMNKCVPINNFNPKLLMN